VTTTLFVPRDAAARSVGADQVAQAISVEAARRDVEVEVVRNGSRGMLWLEPLVEVATPEGRVAYGPVAVEDVAGLFDAGLLAGGAH
jgi:formate dehydrogenase iron-sulfur subunit